MSRITSMPAIFFYCLLLCSCGKKPSADFSWVPAEPVVGEPVKFVNTSRDARKYDWNLGNMTISSEKEPVTTYTMAGQFIVDLTARNGKGRSHAKTATVTVVP